MRIDYIPTFSDYWAFNRYAIKRQFSLLVYLPILLLVLYLVQPLLSHRLGQNLSALEVYRQNLKSLIWPGIFGLVFIMSYVGARQRWSKLKELRDPKVYEIDNEGLKVSSESFTASAEWSLINEAHFTPKFVFLMSGQNQYYFFPVSTVPDMEQLRSLVSGKVAKVKSV